MIYLGAFSDEAASDLAGQIAALKRNNIKYMEMRGIGGKNVKDFTYAQTAEYARALRGEGIEVYSVGSPLGKSDLGADFACVLDDARRVFDTAAAVGAGKVRVFSFFNAYERPDEVYGRLRRLAEEARKYRLTLCHENEKEVYGDTPERVLALKANVPELGIVYDPANFVQCGANARKALESIRSYVTYYHIKDVIAATGEIVPAGHGDCAIRELIEGITGDVMLTLEPHLAVFEGYGAIDGTELKNKFRFPSNGEAFDFAAKSLKEQLRRAGYVEFRDGFARESARA